MPRSPLQNAQHLAAAGKLADAERVCRQALKLKPGNPQAVRLLGQITRQTGKAAESVRIFQQLGQARPNDLQLLGELGASFTEANMPAQALPILRRAVQAMPNAIDWQLWLGKCHLKLFDTDAALAVLGTAHDAAPDNHDVSLQLANALLLVARPDDAEALAREILARKPGWAPALTALAAALDQQSRLDEELAVLGDILEHNPDAGAALGSMAKCLRALGRYGEAVSLLEPLTERALTPEVAMALAPVYLAQDRHEDRKELFERALQLEPMPVPVRASLSFGLGDAHRRLKEYDSAFAAFKRANDSYPRTFDRQLKRRMYDEIRGSFNADTLSDQPRAEIDASKCVFIVGMPRSGTTLVEQVVDAHPRAQGAGELTELQHAITTACEGVGDPGTNPFSLLTTESLNRGARHYLDAIAAIAPHADRVTDKMPHNFEMLGMIQRLLPGAKVIHCSRNPIDNCLSLYFTQLAAWHNYTNDLADLGWAYSQHVELMTHWKDACSLPILRVRYEDMVRDIDTNARRIIEFVGLDWDDRCLRFYESDRAITTASVEQVRKPIYASSVARWKHYEPHLGPLIDSLREHRVAIDQD